jgi:hypothetical protein
MGYQIACKHMRTCGKPLPSRLATLRVFPRVKPILTSEHAFTQNSRIGEAISNIVFKEMNAQELIQHQRRVAAWVLQDQRAKELAQHGKLSRMPITVTLIFTACPTFSAALLFGTMPVSDASTIPNKSGILLIDI